MKGYSSHFSGSYNSAGSANVKVVNKVSVHHEKHYQTILHSDPDSVNVVYKDGKLIKEDYYDSNGDIYLTIDYTNHGNAKHHPKVPHEHHWNKKDGNFSHDKGDE